MSILRTSICAIAMIMVLSACQADGTYVQPNYDLSRINGKWIPTNEEYTNVYYYEYQDGAFVRRSPVDNKLIHSGSYSYQSNGDLTLEWVNTNAGSDDDFFDVFGLFGDEDERNGFVTCRLKSDTEMFCSNHETRFNLQRA